MIMNERKLDDIPVTSVFLIFFMDTVGNENSKVLR